MNRITFPLLGLLLAFVAACGSGKAHRKLDRPRNEVAELRGIPSEFKLLGTTRSVAFTALDGEKLQKGWSDARPEVLDVMPGKHRVGVYYSLKFDGQFGPSGEVETEIDAQAGRIYQADLLFTDAKGWYVEFRDTMAEPAPAEAEAEAVEK